MMFTWSLTTAIIDTVMDLEQAVTAAVCARPKTPGNAPSSGLSGLLHRLFGWMLPALPMLSGRNQVVYSYNVVCLELLRTLKQGWAGGVLSVLLLFVSRKTAWSPAEHSCCISCHVCLN